MRSERRRSGILSNAEHEEFCANLPGPSGKGAAIAGKALLKPTIVGAAGATSHIRDGLMIAVDCAHGSVQRLQA